MTLSAILCLYEQRWRIEPFVVMQGCTSSTCKETTFATGLCTNRFMPWNSSLLFCRQPPQKVTYICNEARLLFEEGQAIKSKIESIRNKLDPSLQPPQRPYFRHVDPEMERWKSMSNAQLVPLLRKQGLKVSGTKFDMLVRLNKAAFRKATEWPPCPVILSLVLEQIN